MRPFSSGSQYTSWSYVNCYNCKLFNEDDPLKSCVLDQALGDALFGDGEISDEVAVKIGAYSGNPNYVWECPTKIEKED